MPNFWFWSSVKIQNRLMFYQISHTTTYKYSQAVTLQPHLVRLRPRSNGWQTLKLFSLQVTPQPTSWSEIVDLDGNSLIKLWFAPQKTEQLRIQAQSQVETHESNPFNCLMEPWAARLAIDYPASLLLTLIEQLKQIPDPRKIKALTLVRWNLSLRLQIQAAPSSLVGLIL